MRANAGILTKSIALSLVLWGATACGTSGASIGPNGPGSAPTPGSIHKAEAHRLLDQQAVCWNTGDLAGFVELYAAGAELTFLGANGLTHGADDLLAGYQQRYPDAETRGVLTFRLEEFRPMGTQHAMVIGHYQLDALAAQGSVDVPPMSSGWFTLILERDNHGLRIVHDHTSESPKGNDD